MATYNEVLQIENISHITVTDNYHMIDIIQINQINEVYITAYPYVDVLSISNVNAVEIDDSLVGHVEPLGLYILDSDFDVITLLEGYKYFSWTHKYREPDTFELKINRYNPAASYLVPGRVLLYQHGAKIKGGEILQREIELTEEGKISENWEIYGKSYADYFRARVATREVRVDNGYDDKTAPAETLMKYYIKRNVTEPEVEDRIVEDLALEEDQEREGEVEGNIHFRARFQHISEILQEICLVSGLGYEVLFDRDNKEFKFFIKEPAAEPTVVFSPEYDNVSIAEFKEGWLDFESVQFVAGQGEGAARLIAIVTRDDLEEIEE